MSKKILFSLNKKSIQESINQLNQYKEDLRRKNDEFVKRLAELGIPVINQNISVAEGDSDKSHTTYINIDSSGEHAIVKLVVEGKDIAFIEFGSGIFYNGGQGMIGKSPHPKGEEKGYTIGSYGKGHGKQNTWGYYDDGGQLILSHGTEATMPVYKASMEIMKNIRRIAMEVFGG